MEKFLTRRTLIEIILLVSLLFVVYSNIQALLKNIAINKKIQSLQTELAASKQRNERLALLNAYYQTSSFQEVEARKRFGMKKPDETVVSLRNSDMKEVLDLSSWQTKSSSLETVAPTVKSNPQLWWEYFFANN